MCRKGPRKYTQMSAIFVMLYTLNPQTLQNFVLRCGCFPGNFPIFLELIYGKPI